MKINKITGLIKATLGDVSTALAYDDMLGEVRSSITGATSWNTAQINDTGFLLGWLRNNSSDYFQLKIQCPHRRKRESTLADIHIHYCTQTAPTAGQTVIYDVYYTWIEPIKVIRGNGSYTGEIGILDADSHSHMIQLGSVNPISDE